jgi:NADH-quinone oxidoreductase subunit M
VVFGQMTNPALATIGDMNGREIGIFLPLILATFALGLQPGLVFNLTNASTQHLVDAFRAATGR